LARISEQARSWKNLFKDGVDLEVIKSVPGVRGLTEFHCFVVIICDHHSGSWFDIVLVIFGSATLDGDEIHVRTSFLSALLYFIEKARIRDGFVGAEI
jgi:hypothetical protein